MAKRTVQLDGLIGGSCVVGRESMGAIRGVRQVPFNVQCLQIDDSLDVACHPLGTGCVAGIGPIFAQVEPGRASVLQQALSRLHILSIHLITASL